MGAPVQGTRQLWWATNTGAWLTVQPSTVNGRELGAQEWKDTLFLRYGIEPPDLPHYCDGFNATFSICHDLDCKQGGFFNERYNKLRDGVTDQAGKYFTPTHVRDDPLICAGCAMKSPKAKPARSKTTKVASSTPPLEATEQKRDLLICDLCQNGTGSVHDMRVLKTDAKSYLSKTQETFLQESEQAKKNIYLEACLQQHQQLLPFVASIYGLLGVEAMAKLKRIAIRLATKWQQSYSRTCGYFNSRIAITLVWTTHQCFWGYRVMAHKISV